MQVPKEVTVHGEKIHIYVKVAHRVHIFWLQCCAENYAPKMEPARLYDLGIVLARYLLNFSQDYRGFRKLFRFRTCIKLGHPKSVVIFCSSSIDGEIDAKRKPSGTVESMKHSEIVRVVDVWRIINAGFVKVSFFTNVYVKDKLVNKIDLVLIN